MLASLALEKKDGIPERELKDPISQGQLREQKMRIPERELKEICFPIS